MLRAVVVMFYACFWYFLFTLVRDHQKRAQLIHRGIRAEEELVNRLRKLRRSREE